MVRERAREVRQEGVEGAEAVQGHGVHDAPEVAVAVAVEAHLLGLPLVGQGLEGARAVQAAVGTVGGAGQAVEAAATAGGARGLVALVKVSEVQLLGDAHCEEGEGGVFWQRCDAGD